MALRLTLPLYPHWTLQDSMSNDPFFICQGKLWSQRGEDKFKEILAQLGLNNFEILNKIYIFFQTYSR